MTASFASSTSQTTASGRQVNHPLLIVLATVDEDIGRSGLRQLVDRLDVRLRILARDPVAVHILKEYLVLGEALDFPRIRRIEEIPGPNLIKRHTRAASSASRVPPTMTSAPMSTGSWSGSLPADRAPSPEGLADFRPSEPLARVDPAVAEFAGRSRGAPPTCRG